MAAVVDRGAAPGCACGDAVDVVELGGGQVAGFLAGVGAVTLRPGQGCDVGRQLDLPPVPVLLMDPGMGGVAAQEIVTWHFSAFWLS